MVLDERALEAMLARQRASEAGHVKRPSVRTEQTPEFEVYERKTGETAPAEPAAPAPTAAPQPAPQPVPTTPPRAPAAPARPAPVSRSPSAPGPGTPNDFEELPGREPPAAAAVAEPAAAPVHEEPAAPALQVPVAPAAPVVPVAAEPAMAEPAVVEETPEAAAPRRRPQVWPPIRARTPEPAPITEPTPVAEPAAPEAQPRTHSPTPHAFAPMSVDGSGCRLAIVQAQFNAEITDAMTEAAVAHATKAGAVVSHRLTVPGVYDLPLTVQHMARRRDVDAVVVIGCVVSGETKHDELITFSTAKTLQEISLATDTPIGLGIIGPGMTWQQAEARIGNGAHAVEAALVQWRALQMA